MSYRKSIIWAMVVGVGLLAGCGQGKQESSGAPGRTAASSGPEVAQQATPIDPATVGTLRGTVYFQGEPPARKEVRMQGNPECSALHHEPVLDEEVLAQDGRLQNVFVYVKEGLESYAFATPSTPVTIDQQGCMYIPHVTGAQVNQPILFLNSDPTLHNIHSYAKQSRGWNFGLPFQGMKQTKQISVPEVMIALKCDVHPWMVGYLGVLPHPYFAVSGPDGSFALPNLPAGTYTVEAWHERFGVQSQQVLVGAGEEQEITFTFQEAAPG